MRADVTGQSWPTVGLAILVHQRPAELADALASASDAGFDQIVVLDMGSDPPVEQTPGVTWLRSDANHGVCVGRNRLVDACNTDVVFFLDDDAVIKSRDLPRRLRELFAADRNLGAVACRIVRPDGDVRSHEFPFRGQSVDVEVSRSAAYFVGAGHAVDRDLWLSVGGLDETFEYSTEEIDIALSILNRGRTIWYASDLVVEHRPSDRGRSRPALLIERRVRNRIIYARRHLPRPVAVLHSAIWMAATLTQVRSPQGLRSWARGIAAGAQAVIEPQTVSPGVLWRAHRLGGRVLW